MQAKDVMTTSVVTATPETAVPEAAQMMLKNNISAMPVVSGDGELVGVVSEGDLLRQVQSPEDRAPSWWLKLFQSSEDKSIDYIKSHAKHVKDVMTKNVVTVEEHANISKIAAILEEKRIKRVPVVRAGKVVGIVSRANLLHGLAAQSDAPAATPGDQELRSAIMLQLDEAIPNTHLVNVVVSNGIVRLMGSVESQVEKTAIDVALENVSGVKKFENNVTLLPLVASAGWV